jgi:hypothetical protein
METDPELQRLIRQWTPPEPSAQLDSRMIRRYRTSDSVTRAGGWRAIWRRFLRARLSVPMPAVAVLLLIAGCLVLLSLRKADGPRQRMDGFEPVALPQINVTRAEVAQ